MTKKLRYKKTKNLSEQELNALGFQGWELAGWDKDEVVLKRDETRLEYAAVQVETRHGEQAQEQIDAMAADGWRLVTVLQGPRAFDAVLLFEREAA